MQLLTTVPTSSRHHLSGDMNYRLTYDKNTPGNSKKNLPNASKRAVEASDVKVTVAQKESGDIAGDDSDSDRESDDEGADLLEGAGGEALDKHAKKALKKKDRCAAATCLSHLSSPAANLSTEKRRCSAPWR